jgi:hypothetical protein
MYADAPGQFSYSKIESVLKSAEIVDIEIKSIARDGKSEQEVTYVCKNGSHIVSQLMWMGFSRIDAYEMIKNEAIKRATGEPPKQYWLITTRNEYSHDSDNGVVETSVYDKTPFEVWLDCQKYINGIQPSGYSDSQILFAQQITKEQYDVYRKWEDTL